MLCENSALRYLGYVWKHKLNGPNAQEQTVMNSSGRSGEVRFKDIDKIKRAIGATCSGKFLKNLLRLFSQKNCSRSSREKGWQNIEKCKGNRVHCMASA